MWQHLHNWNTTFLNTKLLLGFQTYLMHSYTSEEYVTFFFSFIEKVFELGKIGNVLWL